MRTNPSAKLNQKYYGPFQIVEKFGNVAYKLQLLPTTSLLHPISYVSLLERKVGDPSLIEVELATIDQDGRTLMKPKEVLDYR